MAEKRLRWGLLSTARINERLIPVVRESPRCELVAVASAGGSQKAQRYADQWKIPRFCGSYEEMLADPNIDVIYIPLPNSLHAPWAIRAAQAGKHILCEKPLALTAEEVDRMAEAAQLAGVVLQEAAMMRYHPQTLHLQKLIAEGAIGEVRLIRGLFTFTLLREGDIRFDPQLGGGSLWDLGCYPVSFMQGMLGANPIEVQGWQTSSPSGVDLSFSAQMHYPNGAKAQFFSSFEAVPHAEADLLGSAGRIHLDLPWINKVGVAAHARIIRASAARSAGTFGDSALRLDEEVCRFDNVNGYLHEVEALAACILDGAPPVLPLTASRGNIATLQSLSTSAREDRPVKL